MNFKDALGILEVDESMDFDEIRRSYRDLIQIWHPDRYAYNKRLKVKAEEKLKAINIAFEIIKDHYKDIPIDTHRWDENKRTHQESAEQENSSKEHQYSIVKCISCGTKNRLPTSPRLSPDIKCGHCHKNLYHQEKDTSSSSNEDFWKETEKETPFQQERATKGYFSDFPPLDFLKWYFSFPSFVISRYIKVIKERDYIGLLPIGIGYLFCLGVWSSLPIGLSLFVLNNIFGFLPD